MAYDSFPQLILDIIGIVRIQIKPFYLFREGLIDGPISRYENTLNSFVIERFDREAVKKIAALPDRDIPVETLLRRLDEKKVCYGVMHDGHPIAFTWFNLQECDYPGCRFKLKEDEAYLFDAHTATPYRGGGLAPWIRYQTYKALRAKGRTRLYSISERFNAPAIRFKRKLNGKIVDRGTRVELFKTYSLKTDPSRLRNKLDHLVF